MPFILFSNRIAIPSCLMAFLWLSEHLWQISGWIRSKVGHRRREADERNSQKLGFNWNGGFSQFSAAVATY